MAGIWSYLCCDGGCCLRYCLCSKIGLNYFQQIRIVYVIIYFLFHLYALFVLIGLRIIYQPLSFIYGCDFASSQNTCLNFGTLFRLSFSLFILEFIIFFCLFFRNGFSRIVNEGVWPVKLIMIAVIFCLSIPLPDTLIRVYGWIATFGSGLYIIVFYFALCDVHYILSDSLFGKYRSSSNKIAWGSLIVFMTVFLFSITFLLIAINIYFYWTTSCVFSIVINIISIVMCAIITLFTLFGINKNANLFIASGYTSYTMIFTWQLLQDNSDECSGLKNIPLYCINVAISGVFFFFFFVLFGSRPKQKIIVVNEHFQCNKYKPSNTFSIFQNGSKN